MVVFIDRGGGPGSCPGCPLAGGRRAVAGVFSGSSCIQLWWGRWTRGSSCLLSLLTTEPFDFLLCSDSLCVTEPELLSIIFYCFLFLYTAVWRAQQWSKKTWMEVIR